MNDIEMVLCVCVCGVLFAYVIGMYFAYGK